MKSDLHVHSDYSDGSNSVEEVIRRASFNGITQISIVDHDTVKGLPEILSFGEKYEIDVIAGIEISAYDFKRKRKVHVLGYNYDSNALHIESICRPVRERRQAHSLWQIDQIKAAGYELDKQAIMEATKPSNTIYKQHIMKHLTEASYTSPQYKQLYRKLFKGDGVAAGDIEYLDAFDAVRAIVADGGIAVVAHPGQLNSYELIPELVQVGLGGIEWNHPDHKMEDHRKVKVLANNHDLMMTGGTDYHGVFGEFIEIGDILSPINLNNKLCKQM